MAKTCIQCGKKIGMFQKAVDGIYCSLDCQAVAQAEIVKAEQVAAVQRAEAQKQAEAAAEQAAAQYAEEQAAAKLLQTCPKCGVAWSYAPGPPHRGRCDSCGFSAEFTAIEACPSCSGTHFVVASDGTGRCPRCKYRSG
jgi:membrane protease subunit (stomatin/prohibitin family)